ncbi:cupin domain-containing protein [Alkalihalobacillus sp. AL-G]|uniref:cupin domain-containing protein n=1 Tax=Alkalihalobacillus sp. AL-G TaxID=2926399 RepID=UPI002729C666|nr:cupin domain-containing protein [Alkalihalobacillus sp. AL-G]WLD93302.1 cupin domain-containing protein [Alkalihalobacillus sp. AL-G]
MKIFRFDKEVSKRITQFDSNFWMSRITATEEPVHIGCMHIEVGGIVGFHQAVTDQLFLVVSGEGWVRGEDEERISIKAGEAAFWVDGEWHESGSENGMTTIVIESTKLAPSTVLQAKQD